MPEITSVPISAVHVYASGEYVIVKVEAHGAWAEIARERLDGAFSTIVEAGGLSTAIEKIWARDGRAE